MVNATAGNDLAACMRRGDGNFCQQLSTDCRLEKEPSRVGENRASVCCAHQESYGSSVKDRFESSGDSFNDVGSERVRWPGRRASGLGFPLRNSGS